MKCKGNTFNDVCTISTWFKVQVDIHSRVYVNILCKAFSFPGSWVYKDKYTSSYKVISGTIYLMCKQILKHIWPHELKSIKILFR